MGALQSLKKGLQGLFGWDSGKEGSGSGSDQLLAEEERMELFAQVDGYYRAWEKAVTDMEQAKAFGEPSHRLEMLNTEAKRFERKFRTTQVELRDIHDMNAMKEQSAELEARVQRLRGGQGVAGIVTAKDEATLRRMREKEREEAEMEDELLQEQLASQEERYRIPAASGEMKRDDDLGLTDQGAPGKEKEYNSAAEVNRS